MSDVMTNGILQRGFNNLGIPSPSGGGVGSGGGSVGRGEAVWEEKGGKIG